MKSVHISALLVASLTVVSLTPAAQAASESVVYTFPGGSRGKSPSAAPIQVGPKLYGTTSSTVFSLTLAGKQKVLHAFQGCADGMDSVAPLVNVNNTLYGTTQSGGNPNCGIGSGTVFSVTPQGAYSTLYRFGADNAFPESNLTLLNGVLYGTTRGGGSKNSGTVFSLTLQGALTVLYDPFFPTSGLTALDGSLYGVDEQEVYRISPSGAFKNVHYFGGDGDGSLPEGNLLNMGGTLYGVTQSGGTGSSGVIFSVTPDGSETVLYSFQNSPGPSPLIYVNGVFYGTTYRGGGTGCGGYGCGTVYSFTPQGVFTTIYTFQGGTDGSYPSGGLLDVGGALYGTTNAGGNGKCRHQQGCGTVFKITP